MTSGRTGPLLSPFNLDQAQAYESLRRLDDVAAGFLLPGHGAPWREGVGAALAAIRRDERHSG